MHHQDHDEQALAVTIALLLLIGGVLLVSLWLSVWWAFAAGAIPVVTAYALPRLLRRRALRRFLRSLRSA